MDKDDLYYQVARDRYMSQETQLHEFQRRAIQVISFGGLLLGLGMVYLRVEVANREVSLSIAEPVVIVFLVMVAPFAYSAALYQNPVSGGNSDTGDSIVIHVPLAAVAVLHGSPS